MQSIDIGAMEQCRPLRVLIVGLQDQFGRILAINIQRWGHKVVMLPNMAALREGAAETLEGDVLLYDLDEALRTVVSDQDVPSTNDHVSVVDFLRSNDAPLLRNCLTIVFSCSSVSRTMLEQIGAVALLQKPFHVGRLQRYLGVLQRLVYAQDRKDAISQIYGAVARVLVVDDDEGIARAIAQCLDDEADYDVVLAHDGLDALEKCLDWRPQCVVTDLIMPWMNGYQVIRCLAHSSLRSLPAFVIISALPQREVLLSRSCNEKAVTYVDKPFHIEHLLAAIKQACA